MRNADQKYFELLSEIEYMIENEVVNFEKLPIDEQNYIDIKFDNSTTFIDHLNTGNFVEGYLYYVNPKPRVNVYNARQKVNLKKSNDFVFVIFTCRDYNNLIIYNIKNDETEVKKLVKELTSGCNYDYEFVEKKDNIYYFK